MLDHTPTNTHDRSFKRIGVNIRRFPIEKRSKLFERSTLILALPLIKHAINGLGINLVPSSSSGYPLLQGIQFYPPPIPQLVAHPYMDPSHEHIPPTLFSSSPFIPATVNGIMTELSFAKSYLSLLDSRVSKKRGTPLHPFRLHHKISPSSL